MSTPTDLRKFLFGDGLSTDPDPARAAEDAVAQALAPFDGQQPDLLCLFVSSEEPNALEVVGHRALKLAQAKTTVGCVAGGVIGAGQGVEAQPAVSVFAASLPEATRRPFRLELQHTPDGPTITGMPDRQDDDVIAVLLADPATFPVAGFVQQSNEDPSRLPLIGGVASGPGVAGSARLYLDGDVLSVGAVGLVLGGAVTVGPVVSQGCRPFGPPMVVTKAERNILLELAGTPALTKLEQIVSDLTPADRQAIAQGLNIGVVMDEYAPEHERGDFLIRGVLGADRDRSAIAIGDFVEVGRTVRFQVRDAAAAEEDLTELFTQFRAEHGPVGGALLFSCNGRGRAMFPTADHDVAAVRSGLDVPCVAGFFAAGEIGPVAGRNYVHGFTASILAFGS